MYKCSLITITFAVIISIKTCQALEREGKQTNLTTGFTTNISNQTLNIQDNLVETTKVVNTLYCTSCPESPKERKSLYYDWYEQTPNYAKLAEDTYPSLPSSFSICLGVSITMNHGQQMFLSIRGNEEKPFLGLAFSGSPASGLQLIIGSTWIPMHTAHGLPHLIYTLPNQWVLNCLSISFENGMAEWVIDGEVIVSANMSVTWRKASAEAEKNRPTNLSGKILLGVIETPSGWVSPGNKVTNLNIFSSSLP